MYESNLKEIKAKYRAIRDRAFKNYLELFQISYILKGQSLTSITLEKFKEFKLTQQVIDESIKVYQLPKGSSQHMGIEAQSFDNQIKQFDTSNKDIISNFKSEFINRVDFLIDEDNFIKFYQGVDCCGYCETSKQQFKDLIESGKIKTKRLSTRGRNFEVDQIKPNKGYIGGNLILACYWCNNAKTDEFSHKEFKLIANGIGEAFRMRLK